MTEPTSRQAEPTRAWVIHPELTSDRDRRDAAAALDEGGAPIMTAENVSRALQARRGRPIFVIDIGVPRNVDPAVNELDNVYLYDIDFLEKVAAEARVEREKQIAVCESLISKHIDDKGIEALAVELNETAAKTRERRISPADMEGGSFTISNLGGIGGTAFTPVVVWPQAAILGVSRARRMLVEKEGEFVPRTILPLSLSYDHRIVDGADAARFMDWICRSLEQGLTILL